MNTSYYKHIILLFVTVMKCSSVTNRSYNNYFTTLPLLHYRESERGGGWVESGRCWPVTQSELWFFPGRHGSHWQTQVGRYGSCESVCAVPRTCACYVGCLDAGHMIAAGPDAWVRDSQLSGDSQAKSANQEQEPLSQIIHIIIKEE